MELFEQMRREYDHGVGTIKVEPVRAFTWYAAIGTGVTFAAVWAASPTEASERSEDTDGNAADAIRARLVLNADWPIDSHCG
ncbi:MAG TPA: hypothetical protein VGS58_01695, partial [Candidatus Sulfopaludibacter sp.]|nr:hypothetical protein [Candidatus Sulfopaludibacter sp.]